MSASVSEFNSTRSRTSSTNIYKIGGTKFTKLDATTRTKLLRRLSSLEGILCVANSLLKGTTAVVSELGTSNADVLKDLGRLYREILWQISVCSDSKVEEKQSVTVESENADAAVSNAAERESDNDLNIPV